MQVKGFSRRTFLRGVGPRGALIRIGLPPLEAMFNTSGTAYAAPAAPQEDRVPVRLLVQRQRHSREILDSARNRARLRDHAVPEAARAVPQRHSCHHRPRQPCGARARSRQQSLSSMSAVVSCEPFTGRGAGGPSIDQVIAGKIGRDSRFASLQIGVSQESFGESIQRNMSWADRDRPLPPEMIPHRLFDRLFGEGRVLDRAPEEHPRRRARRCQRRESQTRTKAMSRRLDEYLSSVRDLERRSPACRPSTRRSSSVRRKAATCATGRASPSCKAICWSTRWPRARRASRRTC